MELILFAAGLILGGVISWIITVVYHRKSSTVQELLFNRLTIEVREAILSDTRQKLTASELLELFNKKIINADIKEEGYPYIACPKCGSEHIEKGQGMNSIFDGAYDWVKCEACGWSERK